MTIAETLKKGFNGRQRPSAVPDSRGRLSSTIHQDGVEDVRRQIAAQSFFPIVLRCHRTGDRSQSPRKRRPDDHKIEMAGVIREIDPLPLVGLESDLSNAAACKQAGDADHARGNGAFHRALRPRTITLSLRYIVTSVPMTMTISAATRA